MIITQHVIDLIKCKDAPIWMAQNNAYGLEENELLAILKEKTNFYDSAKMVFDTVRGDIIKESNSYVLGNFKVISFDGTETICKTENELNVAKVIEQNKQLAIQNPNFIVNHVAINENNDHVWSVVNLETTNETSNFQVFNPLTGMYTSCETLEIAKNTFADIKQQVLNSFGVKVQQQITGTSGDTNGDTGWIAV
jgi:hypothetical protein